MNDFANAYAPVNNGRAQNMPADAPPTVLAALASLDELNKRLYELCDRTHSLAAAIGGPVPALKGSSSNGEVPRPSAVVHRLNDGIRDAHDQITIALDCIGAMSRSLGM